MKPADASGTVTISDLYAAKIPQKSTALRVKVVLSSEWTVLQFLVALPVIVFMVVVWA